MASDSSIIINDGTINIINDNYFIATQGPKPNTIEAVIVNAFKPLDELILSLISLIFSLTSRSFSSPANFAPNSLKSSSAFSSEVRFSTYNFSFRWLIRGDTLCEVIIPQDSEFYKTVSENEVYVCNKMILTNPKKIDDEFALELYKLSTYSSGIVNMIILDAVCALDFRRLLEFCLFF